MGYRQTKTFLRRRFGVVLSSYQSVGYLRCGGRQNAETPVGVAPDVLPKVTILKQRATEVIRLGVKIGQLVVTARSTPPCADAFAL